MSTGPVRLREEQRTMLMSLYLHARDAQSAQPILGDEFTVDLLKRVDHDVSGMTGLAGNLPVICARARLIDDATRSFLDRHPDAVVLHLGCGLDSRVLRIAPGPGVDWIEVDQEPVIELRHRLYPDHDGVTMIAASVTDPAWWDRVPSGRPQLVLAEGLLMYLAPDGLHATIAAAFERPAPHHTLIADTVAPWVTRIAGRQPTMRAAGTGFRSSTQDLSAIADSRPDLALRGEISLVSTAAHYSRGAMSGFLRVFDLLPAGHRAMVLHTYGTPDAP